MKEEIENNNKIKHLEFIQLTITRMGVNSFLLKGWTITLIAALFAFASKDAKNFDLALIAEISTLTFWLLDSYFLKQERLYRNLYDQVIKKNPSEIDFSMNTTKLEASNTKWVSCFVSKTLTIFYFSLLILVSLSIFLIKNL
jgi:hypothetical protein